MATRDSRYTVKIEVTLQEDGKQEKPMMIAGVTYNGLNYERVAQIEALIPGVVGEMNKLGQQEAARLK